MLDAISKMQSELTHLRVERSRIDASIAELEAALKVIARYSQTEDKPSSLAAQVSLRKTPSKREQIFHAVLDILSDGKTRHTAELLNELVAKGVDVGGDKPEANLSAYLSRAKEQIGLIADRRYGWSLKKQSGSDVAPSEPLPDGSDLV